MKRRVLFIALSLVAILSNMHSQEKLYENTFSLSDVKLLDGPFKHALDVNVDVLLQYDVDRLLAPFLREAGLTAKAEPYGNWESDGLDGHIGGHYISAMAIHYAASGNETCKERMEYMISELKRCQVNSKHGKGYIGGFPVEIEVDGEKRKLWEEIRKGNVDLIWKYWVPWYNVHKTYAGLRDAWLYAGNEEAKSMFLELSDWGIDLISHLDDKQMEAMLDNEFGGMNEVYADAYQMTKDEKYLNAAKRFSHKVIFDSMAKEVDNLDNRHANTQVPKAVGYQRVAELSNESDYTTAATFFWETVVNDRSLSFGGNSRREHFPSKDDCISYTEEREGPESCNTNNMMKLTEGLFRMNPDAKYADFYERAMYNHILSTQHPEHGGYVYFTSARPSHYRVYSAPNEAMWCCVGTGMENHGKYGEFIYSHDDESLFVNLFVASELNWKDKGVTITQNTEFPYEENSKLTINTSKPVKFKLLIRYPGWVSSNEMEVNYNGTNYASNASPSSYIEIEQTWKDGDVIEIKLPMKVTLEEMPNVSNFVSIMRGPILLGAKTSTEGLVGLVADDHRWAHIAHGPLVSLFDTPALIGERSEIQSKLEAMKPVSGKPLSFTVSGLFNDAKYDDLVLEPFYNIHDSRYMMYWLTATTQEYDEMLDVVRDNERFKLELDKRTVDAIKTGEQQPESDHRMRNRNSQTGSHYDVAWRDVRNQGFLQYTLNTNDQKELSLMVQYWGNETGNKAFDILIDEKLLVTENLVGKWSQDKFINQEYKIPAELLNGKKEITVRFQPKENNATGKIFYIRLLNPE